jgi:hypothetical protein
MVLTILFSIPLLLYKLAARKGVDYPMDNHIDRSKAESPEADIDRIDQMSALFMRSQMAKAPLRHGPPLSW